jgi:hypothetical protein
MMTQTVDDVEEARRDSVHIKVNRHSVELPSQRATGREIKEAAIAQGVKIEVTFQLTEIIADHKKRNIRNDEEVHLQQGMEFKAVAGDDNS